MKETVSVRLLIRRARLAAGVSVSDLAREITKSRTWLALRESGFEVFHGEDVKTILGAIRNIAERRLNLFDEVQACLK